MNPVDKAFMNAYAKKRPTQPAAPAAPIQTSRPIVDPTGSRALRIDTPSAATHPAQPPHVETSGVAPQSLSGVQRSPSIVVPRTEAKLDNSAEAQAHRIRLRIDQANAAAVVPAPKAKVAVPPAAPLPAVEAAPVQRRTLTSYLQQARQTPAAAPVMLNPPTPAKVKPAVAPAPPAKRPPIASRWTQPNDPAVSLRIDPPQTIHPPVNRPEEIVPWSFNAVERSTKATADVSSVSAKTINPPNARPTPAPIAQPTPNPSVHSDNAFSDYAFEAIVTPNVPTSTRRLPDGSFGSPDSAFQMRPSAPMRPMAEATDSAVWNREARIDSAGIDSPIGASLNTRDTRDLRPAAPSPDKPTFPVGGPHFQTQTQTRTVPAQDRRAEQAAKVVVPIQSLWEVDQFYWPTTVENLMESQPEAFDEIGLHFQHMQSKGLRVLSVTSGERGVGRSTVAMCLARAVAKTGLRVALVDGDYETPSLIDQLNMAVDHGWQECLASNIPLDEVVVQSIEDNIALVPLTDSIGGSIVNDQVGRINKLLKRLSVAYDFVVIDGNRLTQKHPRLVGTGEDSVLDAALVIVDAELSLRQRIDTAIELLREQGIQSIGLAENFHTETSR